MTALPTGTVTFLFTDIEGSTDLLQRLGDRRYAEVLAEHQWLLRDAFAKGNGQEIHTQGDAFLVAFGRAREAVATAVAAQQTLMNHAWPDGASLRVRMGLHTGEPVTETRGYVGLDVHRAARICSAGHGGQILLSDAVSGLAARDLPPGVSLWDLGTHRLRDLREPEHLLQVVHPDLPADFPPLKSLDVLPNNLPRQLTSFVGREKEITEVKRLLSTAYLVTLTGSGGAGKTRLALQVAADVLENYSDGVWLSELAPIADPVLVPKTVASVLSVPEQPGRDMTETLVDILQPKTVLLVLDNCEHLLTACRDLALALLRKCTQVRILATSREGLGIPGETLWRVPSLSMPDLRHLPPSEELVLYDAVRLFLDRAVANIPGFVVTNENAAAVARVCQRLDGIPLAIELAAARVKVLAVEQIANRLDDRFRLLTGGSPVALPRHRTLQSAIDWSHNLLSESERVVLRRLSVFAGGWTLEAAESVCGGGSVEAAKVLDLLTSLVDKSLVLAETQRGEARYRLQETVRQFGMDKLEESGEADNVRTGHRDWYLDLAERAEPRLRGPEQLVWLERLENEHDNLRTALEWCGTEGDAVDAGLRLAGTLAWFWRYHGHWNEGRRWLEEALARSGNAPSLILAKALRGATLLAFRQGDFDKATELSEKGLDVCHSVGEEECIPYFLTWLSVVASARLDFKRATALNEESLAMSRELGDKWLSSMSLSNLGGLAANHGNFDRATAYFDEACRLCREVGDKWLVAHVLRGQGDFVLDQGDYKRAEAFFIENLTLSKEVGSTRPFDFGLEGLAGVACEQGHYERAARLLGAVEALMEDDRFSRAARRPPHEQAGRAKRVATMRASLGNATFEMAWAEGRAMTLEQAIEYALKSEAN